MCRCQRCMGSWAVSCSGSLKPTLHHMLNNHVKQPVMTRCKAAAAPGFVVLASAGRIFTDAAALERAAHPRTAAEPSSPSQPRPCPSSVADVLTATPEGRRCADIGSIPIAGLNLTADEIALLPQLCWHADQVASFPEPAPVASVAEPTAAASRRASSASTRNGAQGVRCAQVYPSVPTSTAWHALMPERQNGRHSGCIWLPATRQRCLESQAQHVCLHMH